MGTETSSIDSTRTVGARALAVEMTSPAAAVLRTAVVAGEATVETPSSMVSALHSAFGDHHARAVHAKGTILEGSFTPTAQARDLSEATVFSSGTLPVTVRFSDFTGIPNIPDTIGDANPRGFAIKFHLPAGAELDLVTHSFNGFPTRTSDEFAQLLRAIGASGAASVKPTALDRFLGDHPVARTFLTTQKPAPVSFGTLNYFGVNAFTFIDAAQTRRAVRYRFVPASGEQVLDAAALETKGPNYLQEEIGARVATATIVFDWFAQVGETDDLADDPSIAWPESRQLVKLGIVTIARLDSQPGKTDKALLFLPGRLPAGIEICDPMIAMRSAAYPISFDARQ